MSFTETSFYEFPSVRVSEVASADRCKKCYSMYWTILVAGFKTHLDPEPLTALLRLAAYVSGRTTVNVYKDVREGFKAQLRTPHRILKDDLTKIVLAEHFCNSKKVRITLPNYFPSPIVKTTYEGEFPF